MGCGFQFKHIYLFLLTVVPYLCSTGYFLLSGVDQEESILCVFQTLPYEHLKRNLKETNEHIAILGR
jgi:hypothetical protein